MTRTMSKESKLKLYFLLKMHLSLFAKRECMYIFQLNYLEDEQNASRS